LIEIYLVRHGQASFTEQDYDKLSAKGMEQARILGSHWQILDHHNTIGNVQYYAGSLLRHKQTADCFFEGLLKQSDSSNQMSESVIIHAGFNELDHVDVLSCYNNKWQSFQAMSNSVKQSHNQNSNDPILAFEYEFHQAIQRWISGDFDEYKESWMQFKQRCITSLQEVINTAESKKFMIFTSGGVIGMILGYILKLNDEEMLKISQQLVNSSITKVTVANDEFKLNYFNNYSHLEMVDQEWLSYF